MESTKLTQRLAGYIEAIQAARAEGVTWRQLAALFGADCKYFHASVKKIVSGGRHVGREQKPLPEAEPKLKAIVAVTTAPGQTQPAGRYSSAVKAPNEEDIDALFNRGSTK